MSKERIERELWEHLHIQEQLLNKNPLSGDDDDVHYLEGKREGLEEALITFYDVDNIKEVYEREPDD